MSRVCLYAKRSESAAKQKKIDSTNWQRWQNVKRSNLAQKSEQKKNESKIHIISCIHQKQCEINSLTCRLKKKIQAASEQHL